MRLFFPCCSAPAAAAPAVARATVAAPPPVLLAPAIGGLRVAGCSRQPSCSGLRNHCCLNNCAQLPPNPRHSSAAAQPAGTLPLSPPPPLAAAHQPISNCMSSSGGPSGQAALPPLPAPVAPPPPLLAPRPPAAALAGAAGAAARPSRALSGMPCNGRGRWKVQCELQQGARCDCQAASCTKKPRPPPMKRTVRQQQLATATTSCSPVQAAVAAAHQLGGLRLWWPPLLGLGPNVNLKLELEGC